MASQANLAEIPKARKKQKIFGAMTTSRWIGVCIFLCGILYSYTSGPPLERLWRINPYFRDYRLVDRNSLRKEGNNEIVDAVFGNSYFPATWLQQIGSHFGEVEQFTWNETNERLFFVDSVISKVFSYHVWTGLDIEYEFPNDTYTSKKGSRQRPGPSGIAIDPKEADSIYISEPSLKRISRLNIKSGKTTPVVQSLNDPYHLTLSPSQDYLYFTEPASSKVSRIKVGKSEQTAELVTEEVKHPTHVFFSTTKPNRAFISNCIEGDYSVYVFDVDKSGKWTLQKQWNYDTLQWKHSDIKGKVGCVRSLTSANGFLLVACPGGRVCIVNEETGIMKAAVKLFDGVVLNDVAVAGNKIWMAANSTFWRSYLYTGAKKTEL